MANQQYVSQPFKQRRNITPTLDVDKITKLIDKMSIPVLWQQARRCVCLNAKTQQPKTDCPICHGSGWFYSDGVIIDMMIQSDEKERINSSQGLTIPAGSVATPQITENRIEQGIKVNDRLTLINSMNDTQENYVINVTEKRLKKGLYLPYNVNKINHGFIEQDNDVADIGSSLSLDGNRLLINDDSLLGKTISLVLTVQKRYFVTNVLKETRYTQIKTLKEKEISSTFNNKIQVPNTVINMGQTVEHGVRYTILPPKLHIMRENLFFSPTNIVSGETGDTNNMEIKTPSQVNFDNFFGD